MKSIAFLTLCVCALAVMAASASQPVDYEKNWHQWRGPHATGAAASDANPPLTWSETENVRWKVAIPGMGHATPIVWEEKIFVQTAIQGAEQKVEEPDDDNPFSGFFRQRSGGPTNTYQFALLAINRSDGSILWQKTLREEVPHEGTHQDASFASNSPVTDGEYVYAYFGSRGLYCVDMDGNVKWEKDIGEMRKSNAFGEGSCPVLYGNTLIIVQDHEGPTPSFIIALDKRNGDVLWKTERDERTTWTTPVVVEQDGKPQVIVPATNRTRSYDLATGKLLWECGGLTRNVIPTPVADDGFVYVTSGFRGNSLQAIRLDVAKDDITDSDAIVWQHNRNTPYVPSPLLYQDALYFLKSNDGILSAFNIKTGEANYGPERLQGISNVYSSIVGAAGRVYIASRNGTVLVVKHSPTFQILATNKLDDSFNASPVIVGSELYLRGQAYLYCIAE